MNKDELLYLYFSNSLTPNQEQLFEDLLEKDTEFKAQFEFEKSLKEVIKAEETDNLKAKLKEFEKQIATKTETSKPWFNWSIAASVVLLLGVSWFGYDSFFGVDFDSLYEHNYKNYPNTVYTITRGGDNSSLERDAFVAYETEAYQQALDKFNAIEKVQPYFNFYKAQSYLGLNNLKEAKSLFETEILNQSKFKAEAHWYLALINLKQQNVEEASKNLKILITKHDYKKNEAKTLLNDLQ